MCWTPKTWAEVLRLQRGGVEINSSLHGAARPGRGGRAGSPPEGFQGWLSQRWKEGGLAQEGAWDRVLPWARRAEPALMWWCDFSGGCQVPQEAQWGPEQLYFLEKLVSMNTNYVNKVFAKSVIFHFSLSLAHNTNWHCCYLSIITSFSFASLAGQRSSITLGIRISSGSLSWISSSKRSKTWDLMCEYAAPSEWKQTALCVPRARRCGSRGAELCRFVSEPLHSQRVTLVKR